MKHYYFNKSTDDKNRHEIHTGDCSWLPSISNREYIGYFNNCSEAIKKAKQEYPSYGFDGCFFCCRDCHKG